MSRLKVIAPIALLLIFFSCKKDVPNHQPLIDLLKSGGSWSVTDYVQEFDTTAHTGITLVFHTNGAVEVQSITDSGSGSGKWSTSSFGDGTGAVMELLIDLEGDDFLYLEANWIVHTLTPTELKLGSGIFVRTYMTLVKN